MQAFIVIALFGLVYAVISGMTIMFSLNSMQLKLQRIEQVNQIFHDFEKAVNKGIISRDGSLEGMNTSNMLFAREFLNWSNDQLQEDAWGNSYTIITALPAGGNITLYADEGVDLLSTADNNYVSAPVRAFALISSGPDLVLSTTLPEAPVTFSQIQQLEASSTSDDIIHVFTTSSSMMMFWEDAHNVYNKIRQSAIETYQRQYDQFLPSVSNYYSLVGIDIFTVLSGDSNDVDADIVTAVSTLPVSERPQAILDYWKIGMATGVTSERFADKGNCSTPCYPEISSSAAAVGVENEVSSLAGSSDIEFNFITVDNGLGGDAYDKIDLQMRVDPANFGGWDISYTLRIDGEAAVE